MLQIHHIYLHIYTHQWLASLLAPPNATGSYIANIAN